VRIISQGNYGGLLAVEQSLFLLPDHVVRAPARFARHRGLVDRDTSH
jgi:hypothetical protein